MSDPEHEESPPPANGPAELADEIEEVAQIEAADAEPDSPRAVAEKESLEAAKAKYESEQLKQRLTEDIDLHALRQRYTKYLFCLTVLWLLSVLLFVILTGFKGWIFGPVYYGNGWGIAPVSLNLTGDDCAKCVKFYFNLSNNVLIAFITSTTASVIGIFIIVAKWLFPSLSRKEP